MFTVKTNPAQIMKSHKGKRREDPHSSKGGSQSSSHRLDSDNALSKIHSTSSLANSSASLVDVPSTVGNSTDSHSLVSANITASSSLFVENPSSVPCREQESDPDSFPMMDTQESYDVPSASNSTNNEFTVGLGQNVPVREPYNGPPQGPNMVQPDNPQVRHQGQSRVPLQYSGGMFIDPNRTPLIEPHGQYFLPQSSLRPYSVSQAGPHRAHPQGLPFPYDVIGGTNNPYMVTPYGYVPWHPDQIPLRQQSVVQSESALPSDSVRSLVSTRENVESESDTNYSDSEAHPPQEGFATENKHTVEENLFRKGVNLVFETLKDSLTPPPSQAMDRDLERYYSDDGFDSPDKAKTTYLFLPMAPRVRWDLDLGPCVSSVELLIRG